MTLHEYIANSIASRVFETKLPRKILHIRKIILAVSIIRYIFDPVAVISFRSRGGRLPLKALSFLTIILTIEYIVPIIINTEGRKNDAKPANLINLYDENRATATIDGLDTYDLVLHLLEYQGLPSQATKEVFGITNEKIKKLGDNLERIGALERGVNNARVLAISDYELLADKLLEVDNSEDLTPIMIQTVPGRRENKKISCN